MKVEIRKYEWMLVAFFGLMTILGYVLQQLHFSSIYASGFDEYNAAHPVSFPKS